MIARSFFSVSTRASSIPLSREAFSVHTSGLVGAVMVVLSSVNAGVSTGIMGTSFPQGKYSDILHPPKKNAMQRGIIDDVKNR